MKTTYRIWAEANAPWGAQIEWGYLEYADQEDARMEAGFLNKYSPQEIINGTSWDIHWTVREEPYWTITEIH